jgi:hypothetical protein
METLEHRECFTVTFGFEDGVLQVTGDEGPNRVHLYQPGDLVMEVEGDGERRRFEGVREVQLTLLGGHDEAKSSKPKEIVVVGSSINETKIKIDAGAGNDKITMDDGGPSETPILHNASMSLDVDLGTGMDEFRANIQHHDHLDLNLTSSDGNDTALISVVLPAVQKVREAASRMNFQLGGGGNQLRVDSQNVENVQFSFHSSDRSASATQLR